MAQVAHPDLDAAGLARRVGLPAGYGDCAPTTVAGTTRGEHERIGPIRQDMGNRRPLRRALDVNHALHRRRRRAVGRHAGFGPGCDGGDIAGDALLQQEFGGTDHRLVMEPRPHPPVVQHIRDRYDGHALVMGHIAVNNRDRLAVGYPRRGEVQRFVEAETPACAKGGESLVVVVRRARIEHRRQPRCIGRDHQVCRQSPLQPQSGHAEVGILVVHAEIAGVECGFRNTPRHTALTCVALLPHDHLSVGALEQAARGFFHDQCGHQVFEHRPGPRDQRRPTGHRRRLAAELKPVARRDIAFGNGKETRKPRFGGQQVIAARIDSVFGF